MSVTIDLAFMSSVVGCMCLTCAADFEVRLIDLMLEREETAVAEDEDTDE